jgi:hypothetical protein
MYVKMFFFLAIISFSSVLYAQTQNGKLSNLENWYRKELYNPACPLRGAYSAGKGEKMQLYYFQNIEGMKDYIEWLGTKTWVSTDSTGYDISDSGSGFVTISCYIGRSDPKGGEPAVFSDNKLKMTYHIAAWRTQRITLEGNLYTKDGMKNGWKATYARTFVGRERDSQTNSTEEKSQ